MTNYERMQELESIGLSVYFGCRNQLVSEAMEEYGIPLDEIIAKLSDYDIIAAVHRSLELYGVEMNVEDEEDEEEEEENEEEDEDDN